MEKINSSLEFSFFNNLLNFISPCFVIPLSRRDFHSHSLTKRVEIHKPEKGDSIFVRVSKLRKPPKKFPDLPEEFIPEREFMIFLSNPEITDEACEDLEKVRRFIKNSIGNECFYVEARNKTSSSLFYSLIFNKKD